MRRPMTGFLSTLNPEQREAALTPFEGDESVGTAVSEQDLIKGMGTLQKRREAAEREARDRPPRRPTRHHPDLAIPTIEDAGNMGQKRAAASPIVARRVDNPHTTYAQFVADVAAGKRDAGKQWVAVNLRTVMGGFFRFNGNEAECRACAAYRAAFDAAQLGGAQAVDPGREPVDGGGANPGMVQIAGSDARRKLAMMDAHLGVTDVKKLRFVVIGERGPTTYAKHFYGDRSPDGRSVSRAKVEVRRIAAKLSAFINLRTQAGESKGVVSVGERPSDLATYDDEAA